MYPASAQYCTFERSMKQEAKQKEAFCRHRLRKLKGMFRRFSRSSVL